MKTPHKHAELIKAWADGAKIEMRAVSGKWVGYEDRDCPTWHELYEYRIKPEPKPEGEWRDVPLEKEECCGNPFKCMGNCHG